MGAAEESAPRADVVVVGAGIVGCTVALRLAQAGAKVVVLERSVPGAEASSVAAGILGPAIEAHAPGLGLALGIRGRERHQALAAELLDAHGIDVGFRRCGVMRVAWTERDARALDEQATMLAGEGIRVERLHGREAIEREPSLRDGALVAFDLPDEAQIEPKALLRAVALAAERSGARFVTGSVVRRVRVEHDRVAGVELESGMLDAPTVVVAAGSWTTLVGGLPIAKGAIYPVRGQVISTHTRTPLFRRIVFSDGGYVVTRPDGRVVIGATSEDVGFARDSTLAGIAELIARGVAIAPGLAGASLDEHAVSFRPATRDALPLVGRSGPDGLVVASGHYRNGILLSAITADLVADLVVRGHTAKELDALDPLRFGP